jgi:hypothetical protein
LPSAIVEEYRRRAEECEEIAKSAILEAHGRRILEMAQAWREMADQREQLVSQVAPKPR